MTLPAVQNRNGTTTQTTINRTYEVASIFADNGTPVQAFMLSSASQTTNTYDANGNLTSTTTTPVNGNQYDCVADCHGFTFGDNKLWINDDQVETILNNDNYARNVSENSADAVIYKNNGNVVHSAKRNANGTYDNNAGIMTTEYNGTLQDASRNLTDINNPANVEFVDKQTPNKAMNTNLGTVNSNGVRVITDPNEIAAFLQQINP